MVDADGGGRVCAWRNALIWLMHFPPAVTLLREYLVTCLRAIQRVFSTLCQSAPLLTALSTSQWKLCVLAFVLGTFEASSAGLRAK